MVTISKAKAKRLGITKRHGLTRTELASAEKKSGQYDVRDGKTFLKRAEPKVKTPVKVAEKAPVKVEKKPIVLKPAEKKKTLGEKAVGVITSPKTTLALGTVLAGLLTGGAAAGAAAAARTGTGVITKTAMSRAASMTTQRAFIGKPGISKALTKLLNKGGGAAGARVATNAKTIAQTKGILGKVFSTKTMAMMGGWAGSVFLGKWGQAEAPEPLTINLRDAVKQATETGDWSIYDEYKIAADEITETSTWEDILLWSPIAAVPGILAKIKGVKKGVELIDAIAEKEKQRQLTETSEEDKWAKIYATQEERRKTQREDDEEYYAGIQDSLARAREEGRAEDEKYYAEINEENRKRKEAADAEELEEMAWKAEYYTLIRDGKHDEAQALLEEHLKGGVK